MSEPVKFICVYRYRHGVEYHYTFHLIHTPKTTVSFSETTNEPTYEVGKVYTFTGLEPPTS